jgi:hypothetical protein
VPWRPGGADTSPSFVYQTNYDGGSFDSGGNDEVVDSAGNAYIVESVYNSLTSNDVLVAKLSPTGAVLFSTYLRGSKLDAGTGLALDGQGGLLVAGFTDSPDFPTVDAAQPVMDARRSGFLTRLSTSDGSILYSSFFGASGADEFHDLAVGPSGDIYLTGVTDSTDFPTVNPLQPQLAGLRDAFVLRLSADARTILYSTYLGGWNYDPGQAIGLDSAGNITWLATPSRMISLSPTRFNPFGAAIMMCGLRASRLMAATWITAPIWGVRVTRPRPASP